MSLVVAGDVLERRPRDFFRVHREIARIAVAIAFASSGAACSSESSSLAAESSQIVYGAEDRIDYFELSDVRKRSLVSASMVALVSNQVITATGGNLSLAKTWGEAHALCPGEPFAEQPAAAFCTGILVDWDLVLTAGHCTRLLAIEDFKAVFGYHYEEVGQLAVASADVVAITEIVAETLDPPGSEPRLDYAWLRLARPVHPPLQPAWVYVAPPPLETGDALVSIGSVGGVPMKWDAGGHAQELRANWLDYFNANTDTNAGASGGGAFDGTLALLGIMARGGTDFVPRADGCNTTVRRPNGAGAAEQFTYAFRAVTELCARDTQASSLCRADCGNPCLALPRPAEPPAVGCSIVPSERTSSGSWGLGVIVFGLAWLARRGSRPTSR